MSRSPIHKDLRSPKYRERVIEDKRRRKALEDLQLEIEEAEAAMCCGECRWFDASFAPLETPEESLGLCEWPSDRLPYSLRYGSRERVAVGPLDGESCPCFERKGNERG